VRCDAQKEDWTHEYNRRERVHYVMVRARQREAGIESEYEEEKTAKAARMENKRVSYDYDSNVRCWILKVEQRPLRRSARLPNV
jgi:hypothetical protein